MKSQIKRDYELLNGEIKKSCMLSSLKGYDLKGKVEDFWNDVSRVVGMWPFLDLNKMLIFDIDVSWFWGD